MPLISVITINRNNCAGLRSTLFSVASQSLPDYEYIVIDGASTDGSVNLLHQFSSTINILISEPDLGIYYAMNKGLTISSGDYVIFLNSGDVFASPHVLFELSRYLPQHDLVYGNIAILDTSGLRCISSPDSIRYFSEYQHDLPPHPSIVVRRSLCIAKGMFDVTYPITADVLLISRIFSDPSVSYSKVNCTVAIFDHSGVSSSAANALAIYRERRDFVSKYFPQYRSALDAHIRLSPFRVVYLTFLATVQVIRRYLQWLCSVLF